MKSAHAAIAAQSFPVSGITRESGAELAEPGLMVCSLSPWPTKYCVRTLGPSTDVRWRVLTLQVGRMTVLVLVEVVRVVVVWVVLSTRLMMEVDVRVMVTDYWNQSVVW